MANTYQMGQSEVRPWGTWKITDCGEGFCVKHISVNPQGVLSLQSHKFRAEYWIIVKGNALVTLEEKSVPLKKGQSCHIPQGAKHRIQNQDNQVLEFVEVQTGDNLDENDITRYADIYNRVK